MRPHTPARRSCSSWRPYGGAPPWAAHREHFYQRATPLGASHAPTVLKVLAADLLLVLLAVASRWAEPAATLGAFVAVGVLLAVLASSRR